MSARDALRPVIRMLTIETLSPALSVCKAASLEGFDLSSGLWFLARTDAELSLVCETARAPRDALAREDGWRAMRVAGTLDFGLTGVLSGIASALADAGIPIFAVSTYDTDYILVRDGDLDAALRALECAGCAVARGALFC